MLLKTRMNILVITAVRNLLSANYWCRRTGTILLVVCLKVECVKCTFKPWTRSKIKVRVIQVA